MLTWLRIIVSYLCLLCCVVFCLLWMRSPYYKTFLRFSATDYHYVGIAESRQRFCIEVNVFKTPDPRELSLYSEKIDLPRIAPNPQFLAARFQNGAFYVIVVPCWFAVLCSGVLGIAARPSPRWRFSLSELFALSTFTAVVAAALTLMNNLRSPPLQ